ncbi:MAG: PilC/PilY family type IV pilus protein [Burkholderiales bacterium]
MISKYESFGPTRTCTTLRRVLALAATSLGVSTAFAAPTDISSTPFTSTTSAQAKPNIMLLMDASQSMSRTHMPDEVEDVTTVNSVGYKAAQCNVLYYNRNQTYLVPKKPDGSPFPTPSFTAARYAGFGDYFTTQNLATVNLSSQFLPYDLSTLSRQGTPVPAGAPAFYYYYTGSLTSLAYGARPCTDLDSLTTDGAWKNTTDGTGQWTRVHVGATSGPSGADERTNFAIWYSYYRTRIGLTKSAASLAFTPLTDSFRVGFLTVNPKNDPNDSSINASRYLAINDFNAPQRTNWFDKLFSQIPGGSSPAREGLARVGRHYAGKTDGINSGMSEDPVQYSCQQNFTIMTTDGYWNADAETPGRGPVQMDGTTLVGQQDGSLTDASGLTPMPLWDGSLTSVRTTRDASNFYFDANCVGPALLRSTSQKLASTKQYTSSTSQTRKVSQQYTTSTQTALQSTAQYATSTLQTLQRTQQYTQSTVRYEEGSTQFFASTSQRSQVTEQYTTQTRVISAATMQYKTTTEQTKKTTLQYSTSTSNITRSKYQRTIATEQYKLGKTQQTSRQTQLLSYNGLTELYTPVATCTPGGSISCSTREVTPLAPVASCTVGTSSSGSPNYITTVCSDVVVSAPTPVASCTAGVTQSASPNFVTSTCTLTTTPATLDTAATPCTPGVTNGVSPNFVKSTCVNVPVTGETNVPVATCTNGNSGSPSYITTACTPTSTPATPSPACTVGSVTSATSPFTKTTCTKSIDTPNVFVANTPVCADQTADSTNNYTKITCATVTTPYAPISSVCTDGQTTNLGSFKYSTCAVTTISASAPIGSASCTTGFSTDPVIGSVQTVCSGLTWAAAVGVPLIPGCTAGDSIGPGPAYVQTRCAYSKNTTYLKASATCTPVLGTTAPYKKVDCNTATTPPTPVASCTLVPPTTNNGSAGNWVYTTCTQTVVPPAPVAACTPNTGLPPYINRTCTTFATPATPVLTCAPLGTTTGPGPQFLQTTCKFTDTTDGVPQVPACLDALPTAGNQFRRITCSTNTTAAVLGPQCAPGVSGGAGTNHLYTTCTKNDLTSSVPVASCTPNSAGAPNYVVTTCPTPVPSAPAAVASCTPGTTTGPGPGFLQTICASNTDDEFVADAAACTNQAPALNNNYETVTCTTTAPPAAFVASCTPGFASSGWPNYVNTTCVEVPGTPPTPAPSCTNNVGAGPEFITTTCTDGPSTGPTPVLTCSGSNSGAPEYITTSCATGTAPGLKRLFNSKITSVIQNFSGAIPIGAPTAGPGSSTNNQVTDGVCYITGLTTPPPLPVPNPYRPGVAEAPLATASVASCTSGWPCVTSVSLDGGSTNSLADVAQYYYVNDLRPGTAWPNTGPGSVPAIGGGPEDDRATWQHMTTFTIALGVSGTLNYRSDYRSSAATTGDFADLRTGAKSWPIWPDPNTIYVSDGNPLHGTFNWNNPRSIDDYWHTAVNGRGQYFSAGNPTSVIAGLSGALAGITARLAAGSGASASSSQPVAGDNYAFVADYVTSKWTGDLRAELIDLVTGAIGTTSIDPVSGAVVPGAPVWSAQTKLDAMTGAQCDNRKIYLFRTGAADNKVNFSWNTQACDAGMAPIGAADTGLNATERGYFQGANILALSQYPSMTDGSASTVDQITAASGANLVNFLRGQRGNEGFESGVAGKLYRDREHVLGDIVNAQPVYVKAPFADYGDAGYPAFKAANAGRTPMVYSAANDGMLHAFYAGTSVADVNGGKEAWAIIPSVVLPNLFKLADANYKNTHQYSVDGTPTAGDVYDTGSATWKTILVGGLNAGGKGYYALDVTDPAAPKGLWEFKWSGVCYDNTPATAGSDCHLGYTFGRPVISKLTNGKWVVMFTSGYNNINSPSVAGDGVGYLYVLDAATGQIIHKLTTGVGDSTTPSGLGQINNFVDNARINNTTLRVYGGDLLGNVWRFDINNNLAPSGFEASLLGTAKDPSGNAEPITVRPELAETSGKPMVFIATGRLLGATDVSDLQVQSVYGIVDPLGGNPAFANLRSVLRPLAMTQVGAGSTAYRTIACTGTTAECGTTSGWVVNLPDSGERVNVKMELLLGTLIVASNVPQSTACSSGGYGWLNFLNYSSGLAVSTSPNSSVSTRYDDGLIVDASPVKLPDGTDKAELRTGDGKFTPVPIPREPTGVLGNRISWRELSQ